MEPRRLRRKYFEVAVPVPLGQNCDELLADIAESIVDNGVWSSRGSRGWGVFREILPLYRESNYGNSHADAAAGVCTTVLIVGGWVSVACTAHRSATRLAALLRGSGSDGHSMLIDSSPTRCGSSANVHFTSTTMSPDSSFALLAQEARTEKVQNASELASM